MSVVQIFRRLHLDATFWTGLAKVNLLTAALWNGRGPISRAGIGSACRSSRPSSTRATASQPRQRLYD